MPSSLKSSFLRLFLLAAPVVILIDVVTGIAAEMLQVRMEDIMNNPQGRGHLLWVYGSTNILTYILLSLLSLSVALFFLRAQPLPSIALHLIKNYGLLLKESLRTTGKIGLWSFLLIVPGLIRFIQLSLVPFVVVFDAGYNAGQKDALRTSTAIVNSRFFRVLFVEFIVYIGLSLALSTLLSEWTSFMKTPLQAVLVTALQSFIFLLTLWLLYALYQNSQPSKDRMEPTAPEPAST